MTFEVCPLPEQARDLPCQLYLAEQLPIRELERNLEQSSSVHPSERYPEKNDLKKAWAHTEIALSTEISSDDAVEHFAHAQEGLDRLLANKQNPNLASEIIDGYALYSFLPAFIARKQKLPLTEGLRTLICDRLGEAFFEIAENQIEENAISDLGRLSFLAAHIRYESSLGIDGMLHPASFRERRNVSTSGANHHFYMVSCGKKFAMVNRRSRNRTHPLVTDIDFGKLARKALIFGLDADESTTRKEAALVATDLMEYSFRGEERSGKVLSEKEKVSLTLLSQYVVIKAHDAITNQRPFDPHKSPDGGRSC